MKPTVITTWEEFKLWLNDNSIVNWKISASRTPQNNELRFSYNDEKSFEENMDICRRRLECEAGRILYATGWRTAKATGGGFSCDIQFIAPQYAEQPVQPAQAATVPTPVAGPAIDMDAIRREITLQVKNEYKEMELARREKELEAREKEYRDTQSGVMGLLTQYFAPVAQAFMQRKMPAVAGVQQLTEQQPVTAQPIHAAQEETEEPQESPFTDEESDELFYLMQRFNAVEPDYLKLIRSVVEMAEKQDPTYNMAKGFLIK